LAWTAPSAGAILRARVAQFCSPPLALLSAPAATSYGLAAEGVLLYEKGGLMGKLVELSEDDRYDAEEWYTRCRRNAGKSEGAESEEDAGEESSEEGEDE